MKARDLPSLGLTFPEQNFHEAEAFLEALGGKGATFTFQTFYDRHKSEPPAPRGDPRTHIFTGTFAEHKRVLQALNDRRAGVFVAINPQRGLGRSDERTMRPRAIWHENDGTLPDNVAHAWPIEPSMVVRTRADHTHVYWLLENNAGTFEEWDTWEGVERHLVEKRGSDKQAMKRCQVLRIPGFYHLKDANNPSLVRLEKPFNGKRYTLPSVAHAFPPVVQQKTIAAPSSTEMTEPGLCDLPTVDEIKWAEIKEMLDFINPDAPAAPTGDGEGTRDRWLRVLMALEATKHPERHIVAEEWSRCGGQRDARYPIDGTIGQHAGFVEGETEYQMSTLHRTSGARVGVGSLVLYARSGGWGGWKPADLTSLIADATVQSPPAGSIFVVTCGNDALQAIVPPQDFLVKYFISGEDTMSMITGKGGLGKSMLVTGLQLAIASGLPAFGEPRLIIPEPGAAISIDLENGPREHTRRLQDHGRAMVEHAQIGEGHLHEAAANVRHLFVNKMQFPLAQEHMGSLVLHKQNARALYDEMSRVRDSLQVKVRWVNYDAFYKFHSLDENSQAHMGYALEVINELTSRVFGAVPRTLVHHSAKGAKGSYFDGTSSVRGASSIENNVRSVISIRWLTDKECEALGIRREQRREFAIVQVEKSNYQVMTPDFFMVRRFRSAWWATDRTPIVIDNGEGALHNDPKYQDFLVRIYGMHTKGLRFTLRQCMREYRAYLQGTQADINKWFDQAVVDGYLRRSGNGSIYEWAGDGLVLPSDSEDPPFPEAPEDPLIG